MRELREYLHNIQSVLRTEIECTSDVDEDFSPKGTSTPMHSVDMQRTPIAHKQRSASQTLAKKMPLHVPDTKAARRTTEEQEWSPITKVKRSLHHETE